VISRLPVFYRYLLLGGFNSLLMYTVYAALIYIGVEYNLALWVDYILGPLISYSLHKNLTFTHRGMYAVTFAKFSLTVVVCFFLNLVLLNIFVIIFAANPYVAQILAYSIVVIPNFFIQKNLIFSSSQDLE